MRYGKVLAKANKTDPASQRFIVRDDGTGAEYFLLFGSDPGRWIALPAEWLADVVWDSPAAK